MNIPTIFSTASIFSLVRHLVLVRHGNAQPATSAEQDRHRELSERGVDQARLIGEIIVPHYGPFDGIYASPYVRARRTAKVALMVPRSQVVNIHELAAEPSGEVQIQLGEAFKELSHAPLSEYLRHRHANAVRVVGSAAATALLLKAYELNTPEDRPARIVAFSHGVIIPATLLALSEMLPKTHAGDAMRSAALNAHLGEAEALAVKLFNNHDGEVSHHKP